MEKLFFGRNRFFVKKILLERNFVLKKFSRKRVKVEKKLLKFFLVTTIISVLVRHQKLIKKTLRVGSVTPDPSAQLLFT